MSPVPGQPPFMTYQLHFSLSKPWVLTVLNFPHVCWGVRTHMYMHKRMSADCLSKTYSCRRKFMEVANGSHFEMLMWPGCTVIAMHMCMYMTLYVSLRASYKREHATSASIYQFLYFWRWFTMCFFVPASISTPINLPSFQTCSPIYLMMAKAETVV